ncbi:DNA polymerase III subunit delta [Vulcanibacillus modesticaldus]|uniref:DNA polymerase III subunit delta n=1 Tax=Vulcanibacillus modesticaldus TaxID=337097 RepID=A0A1D2YS87_9BACI|nr:DNA polymerase III subunit delta [Vulcanibacillus modesticaldus]OEF96908.1 DNA polymerase III subunit delta [Vulcanibacillus modesticaldus]
MEKSSVHLFYGSESYLIAEEINRLIHSLIPPNEREFNVVTYDLMVTPVEEIVQEAEILPFGSDHKLIIAKNAFLFTGQKISKGIEHNTNTLEMLLKQPVEYSTIVFWVPSEKLDERRKIVKLIKKLGNVESFSVLSGTQLVDWVKMKAKTYNTSILDEAAEMLINIIGNNLQLLSQEISKMAIYVGKDGLIDIEVVKELSSRVLEQNIFSLIERIANMELEQAFQIFYDLLKNKEEPIKMIALLARQFRIMLHAKELYRIGYSQQQIATQLGVHPYSIKLAIKQSAKFSEAQLKDILKKLAEIDYEIKTGKKNKILSLEMFMFHLKGLMSN